MEGESFKDEEVPGVYECGELDKGGKLWPTFFFMVVGS